MKEADLHRAIVRYLRLVLPHGFMIQHSPNGGLLKGEVGKAKGLGAIAGWPDLAIYGPEGRAWFLEVKAERGRLSPVQYQVHDDLMDLGFPVAVVRSIDDVRECIREWNLPSREIAA